MDMMFGAWNVGSLCRTGSLKTVASELPKCKLDLVTVQEVRWVEGGSQPEGDYTYFFGNGKADHHFGTGFLVHKEVVIS
jgi:exonuclease III